MGRYIHCLYCLKSIHIFGGRSYHYYCPNCRVYIKVSKRSDWEREPTAAVTCIRIHAKDYVWLVSVKKAMGFKNIPDTFSHIRYMLRDKRRNKL